MLLSTQIDALVIEDRVVVPVSPALQRVEARAPGVELLASVGENGPEYQLVSRVHSGLAKRIPLPVFLLLADTDRVASLRDLLKRHCEEPAQRAVASQVSRDLLADRMLLSNG